MPAHDEAQVNIRLTPVPLGPFTSPTGSYDHICDCTYGCCGWVDADPDCSVCKGTGDDMGEYVPCQRASSRDDRIKKNTLYLAKALKSYWIVGYASESWYGWRIDGTQLDFIELLYEMVVEDE